MRFRAPPLTDVMLLIVSVYVLFLYASGDLNLYIHPRYILFSVSMSILSFVLVSLHIFYSSNSRKKTKQRVKYSYIPLFIIIVSALILPAQTLSSETFAQRSIDNTVVRTVDDKSLSTLIAGSSKGLRLADWSRLLLTKPDPAFFTNKPAEFSGFIVDAGLDNDVVLVSRFVLSCCAVDARPISVPVQIENWQEYLEEDDWVQVSGEFVQLETTDGAQIVLVAEGVQQIDEPENPYAN